MTTNTAMAAAAASVSVTLSQSSCIVSQEEQSGKDGWSRNEEKSVDESSDEPISSENLEWSSKHGSNSGSNVSGSRDDLEVESKEERTSTETEQNAEDYDDDDNEYDEDAEVPFHWVLKCERISCEEDSDLPDDDDDPVRVLLWHSPQPPTRLSSEEALLATGKLLRWGAKERGMMKSQPQWRKEEMKRLCHECGKIPLLQALSLRRHHMKQLNIYRSMTELGLGREADIRESARIFEALVEQFLIQEGIPFYSEKEQKDHVRNYLNQFPADDREEEEEDGVDPTVKKNKKKRPPYPPTPDFLLRKEIIIEKYTTNHSSNRRKNRKRERHSDRGNQSGHTNASTTTTLQRRRVCWIDAKMFYGASTIPHDNRSAVGCLIGTARKYNAVYGPGAFVFMQGYGDRLAEDLDQQGGAMALDCSGENFPPLFLQPVEDHQRTWCADKQGQIWP